MNESDVLHNLMIEFFQLPPTTPISDLTQSSLSAWDSLAMVQLITEMRSAFRVEFDLDEIEKLTSYAEIRAVLVRKGVTF